jgi:flagella basal body P-ring formation protein FlgA
MSCYPQSLFAKAHPTAAIETAVRQFIASSLTTGTDYTAQLSRFDSRLKLPLCAEKLIIFHRTGSVKPGRNSIGITCNKPKKWAIYNSTTVNIFKQVVSLSQPIRRGEIFNRNLLQFETKNIATLRSGYFTDDNLIINKQATRNLSTGTVISKKNVTEPKLIKRGDKVFIKINSPNLEISTMGIAMMDGIKNQNIRIKNQKSKQVIQATVVKPGVVIVNY